jgi:hypothetical protein
MIAVRRILVLSALFTLASGCAVYNDRTIPIEVSVIPNDCVNKKAIIRWLNAQEAQTQAMLTTDRQYEIQRKNIKHKIWSIKYHCSG